MKAMTWREIAPAAVPKGEQRRGRVRVRVEARIAAARAGLGAGRARALAGDVGVGGRHAALHALEALERGVVERLGAAIPDARPGRALRDVPAAEEALGRSVDVARRRPEVGVAVHGFPPLARIRPGPNWRGRTEGTGRFAEKSTNITMETRPASAFSHSTSHQRSAASTASR